MNWPILFICLLCIYNFPLAVFIFIYNCLTKIFSNNIYIDFLVFAIMLLLAIFTFNIDKIIEQFLFISDVNKYLLQFNYLSDNWYKLIFYDGFPVFFCIWLLLKINYHRNKKNIDIKDTNQPLQSDVTKLTNIPNQNIPNKEINQHCLIIGTTGSGKTTTILNFVDSNVYNDSPIIYLDGKGSIDLIESLHKIAIKYNRKFKVFTLRQHKDISNIAGYNPFASGSATEWTNRIMSLFVQASSRGQEHFSLQEQNYINFVANIIYKHGKSVDLRIFLALLEQPSKLLEFAQRIDPIIAAKIANLYKDKNINSLINDVIKLLEIFIYSDYGHLFNTMDLENVINIQNDIIEKNIILFLFDASSYPEDTRKVARMIINDINSSFAKFDKFTRCLCVFDEFASYASENLSDIISLQRSKGMHAIIGTQSITTVKLKGDSTKRVAEELIACCNTYIIHRVNHSDDAKIMADLIGTQVSYKINFHSDENNTSKNLQTGFNLINSYKIDPQIIKDLTTGEAVIYRKAGLSIRHPYKIKVLPLEVINE